MSNIDISQSEAESWAAACGPGWKVALCPPGALDGGDATWPSWRCYLIPPSPSGSHPIFLSSTWTRGRITTTWRLREGISSAHQATCARDPRRVAALIKRVLPKAEEAAACEQRQAAEQRAVDDQMLAAYAQVCEVLGVPTSDQSHRRGERAAYGQQLSFLVRAGSIRIEGSVDLPMALAIALLDKLQGKTADKALPPR